MVELAAEALQSLSLIPGPLLPAMAAGVSENDCGCLCFCLEPLLVFEDAGTVGGALCNKGEG